MDTEPPSICIRASLYHLRELLGESSAGCEIRWAAQMNRHLEALEGAISAQASEPMALEFFEQIAKANPRLISFCSKFHENSRKLLCEAAAVVRLSVRNCEAGAASVRELRDATVLLIAAVKTHQSLESELIGEASRDIGGEG